MECMPAPDGLTYDEDIQHDVEPGGVFHCPDPEPGHSYHLISVEDYYQDYYLPDNNTLYASHPASDGGTHTDVFNTSHFCLSYTLHNFSQPVSQSFRICVNQPHIVEGQVGQIIVFCQQLLFFIFRFLPSYSIPLPS